jgi:PAS domain S-box-containing protein
MTREAHLRSILDTVPEAMIVIDEGGVVTSFSGAAAQLFGYGPEEVIGRKVKMLMPAPYREEHDGYIGRYLRTGQARIIGCGCDRSNRPSTRSELSSGRQYSVKRYSL